MLLDLIKRRNIQDCSRALVTLCSNGLYQAAHAHVQLLSRFWDPLDWSPPGFSVHGTFQARILEWVTISSSRGSSQPRDWTCISCVSCTAGGFSTHWAIREALNVAARLNLYSKQGAWRAPSRTHCFPSLPFVMLNSGTTYNPATACQALC